MKPSHTLILQELARYKFLCTSHLLKLNVLKDRNNVNRELGYLRKQEHPLIATLKFSVDPKRGRLESFHYLTQAGKRWLIHELDYEESDIKLPNGKVDFSHIYWHHRHTLDIEIAMRQWLYITKGEVMVCDRYFDKQHKDKKKGGSRNTCAFPLPTGQYVNPDLVCLWSEANSTKRLLLLELHRGHDQQKLMKQIANHIQLLHLGIPHHQFNASHGLKKGHRLLVVVEEKSTIKSIKNRLRQYLGSKGEEYAPFICFKALDEIDAQSFGSNWQTITGQMIDLQ